MQIIETISGLRVALKNQADIAFVPTMGNLHAGHMQLVESAKKHSAMVVVSIFVNPLQFGPNEDLANYPRTLEADIAKLAAVGVNVLFIPSVSEMYPDFDGKNLNQTMVIQPPAIADMLCGASRPGHFAGVATVVLKLLNVVRPTIAIFGQKDFQQLFIIQQLVQQFNLPIEIIAEPTVREADCLAMSSRNSYLSADERMAAPLLSKMLLNIKLAITSGNYDYASLEQQATEQLERAGWVVDYISVREMASLLPPPTQLKNHAELIILGAARLGKTRLIDNLIIQI